MGIHLLSSDVINQIAAGEVVERPSHLIKELIENSLDAGATQIEIDVQDGGRRVLIKDNGLGISPEDLPLALARHATSKIHQTKDLWQLTTFGFRGEALASIAAVSHLQLTSRKKESHFASQIESHFGKISEIISLGGEFGTSIFVEDLFENIPARLKFLKSSQAEYSQIKNVIKAMALSHPNVQFKYLQESKVVFFWPSTHTHKERTQQIFQEHQLYEAENDGIRLVFSDPHYTVGSLRFIYSFVQNRWIQDRGLQAAILEAYQHLLMTKEYPLVTLWVEVEPHSVDVNIHPTKSQIKFQDPSKIFRKVYSTLRNALEKAPWLNKIYTTTSQQESLITSSPTFTTNLTAQNRMDSEQRSLFNQFAPSVPGADLMSYEINKRIVWADLHIIGQSHLTYILAESDNAFFLIDQHAAHERIVFERLMRSWKLGRSFETQQLLLPLTLDFDEALVEIFISSRQELEKMGIFLDQVGPQTIALRAQPLEIKEKGLIMALEKWGQDKISKGESFAIENIISEIFSSMACHSVIRAGDRLNLEEMKFLLKQMDEFPLSGFCPHGRPVSIEYSFTFLEKEFGRLV